MTDQKSISGRAWLELLVLGFIWGASFLSIRVALDEIGPLTAVAHRTCWAMLVLWAVVLMTSQTIPRNIGTWGAFLVMGLLNNMIPFGLMAWGQLHISSGLTSIFNATTAVFGVLVAAMFFSDERLTARKILGVCVGFSGVAFTIGPEALIDFDLTSLAQVAVIGGTFSYALAGVWGRKMLGNQAPVVAAAGMLTGSTIIALPLAVFIEGPISLSLEPRTCAAIVYYAIIATAVAYLLYYRVLSMAGTGNLLLVTLIIPPIAILLGATVLGETLAPSAYGGFGLLALGLIIIDGRLLHCLRFR